MNVDWSFPRFFNMAKLKTSQFAFRRNDNVGSEGAELDGAFLEDCYFNHGDLEALRNCVETKCIIVGRTGAGKTALLLKLLDEEEHTVKVEPESLSLQYLDNATILPQMETLGVNLGLFYKLLWRHIFAVELIKAKYSLRTENDTRSFLQKFADLFSRDRKKEKAIAYLRTWGEEFWKDTEYRVREITTKLESSVKDTLGAKFPSVFDATSSGEQKCSKEEKAELINRLQEVVNSIQVRELSEVIKGLLKNKLSKLALCE